MKAVRKAPFLYFLCGFMCCHVGKEWQEAFLNLLLQNRIPAIPYADGMYATPLWTAAKLLALAKKAGIPVEKSRIYGLPGLVYQYRMRIGALIGGLLFLLLLFCGTRVIWRVEVEGAEGYGAKAVLDDLEQLGFGVGSYIPALELTDLANAYCLAHPETAWMSINCKGTVAHVRVMMANIPKTDVLPEVGNLIATEDGVIRALHITHGTPCVRPGQVVKKGDLLVSGIVSGVYYDTLLCASGEVIAEVERDILIEIPFEQTVVTAKESFLSDLRVNFFGKSINISINTGKSCVTYGKIEKEIVCLLPGGLSLPLSLTLTEAVGYSEQQVTLTAAEAIQLGHERLKVSLLAEQEEATLLSKQVTVQMLEQGCLVRCRAVFEKNIGGLSAIQIE